MTEPGVAIVGAGMAGLTCARALFAARQPVTVFEKSRGLGGRLATRRVARMAFDHGAQYVVAREPAFRDYCDLAAATGYAMNWSPKVAVPHTDPWLVGVPGMSALVKPLAAGVDVRRGIRIVRANRRTGEWWLRTESGDELGPYARLALAVPAPQAIELLGGIDSDWPLPEGLQRVRMAPCWVGLAAFPSRLSAEDVLVESSGLLAWAARDSGKPGRNSPHDCWVLHATPEWSEDHLESPAQDVARSLLAAFGQRLGTLPAGGYLAAHRWRYARVTAPLGKVCLWDAAWQIGLCGDWCLDARAEAAWVSGSALAKRMIEGA